MNTPTVEQKRKRLCELKNDNLIAEILISNRNHILSADLHRHNASKKNAILMILPFVFGNLCSVMCVFFLFA